MRNEGYEDNRIFKECPICGKTRNEDDLLVNPPKGNYDVIEEVCFDCESGNVYSL